MLLYEGSSKRRGQLVSWDLWHRYNYYKIRLYIKQVSDYRDKYGYSYINILYGNSKNVCKDASSTRHLQYLAETYLCLLQSIRAAKVLYDRYKGGENSVEEIAKKVGFALPPTINENWQWQIKCKDYRFEITSL